MVHVDSSTLDIGLKGRLLPLHKPSPFGEKEVIRKLMSISPGLTGRITTVLAQAAELAIREKTEFISPALLDRAAAAGIFKIPADQNDEADADIWKVTV